MKRVFVVLLGVLLSVSIAHGFYGDIATDRESFTLGVAGQNANQITSLTALFPLKNANGWAGAYVSRQVADSEVVSETLNGHLQGGFLVRGIGIEVYIEATRDKWRMIDLATDMSGFTDQQLIEEIARRMGLQVMGIHSYMADAEEQS